jgi:hypothetical protein
MSNTIKDTEFTDFSLPKTAYAAFDATTLRDLIIDRLTDNGVFTDQIFEGSNMSSIIDVIAYSYHVLLFYLNKTSTESLFSESQVYENMNRIVKSINYKPVGYQTSVLSFKSTCSNKLPVGTYTIPRFSFLDVDGIKYVTNSDITFSKTTVNDNEYIQSIGDNNLLYQGDIIESSPRTAQGLPFETITITTQNKPIDTNTIAVYVQSGNVYSEYTEVPSLFLTDSSSKVFEKRYNESGDYEIKFGNNVTGSKLESGDAVYVYYIESDEQAGIIGKTAIDSKKMILYSTPQFITIRDSIKSEFIKYLSFSEMQYISFSNTNRSTTPKTAEGVDDIRVNAPISFQNQDRLITTNDFKQRLTRKFGNILTDVSVHNNKEYIDSYVKYFHDDLGLNNPNLESRALLNQVYFSSTTNFNNIYAYCVPRLENKTSANIQSNFLTVGQKNSIKNSIQNDKIVSCELTFVDPVYMAVDIYPVDLASKTDLSILSKTRLIINKSPFSQQSDDSIKQQVYNALVSYFSFTESKLGQVVDISQLVTNILGVKGVAGVYTSIEGSSIKVPGLCLAVWNPVYTSDTIVINQNIELQSFKFPYLYDEVSLLSKIKVVSE